MSKYMSLPSFILKEKFNIHKANKLLHTDLLDDETKAGLKKYMKYSANGLVRVRYTPNEIGRLTIRIDTIKTDKEGNPKDTCRSQYNMYNIVKATICHNIYDDLVIRPFYYKFSIQRDIELKHSRNSLMKEMLSFINLNKMEFPEKHVKNYLCLFSTEEKLIHGKEITRLKHSRNYSINSKKKW